MRCSSSPLLRADLPAAQRTVASPTPVCDETLNPSLYVPAGFSADWVEAPGESRPHCRGARQAAEGLVEEDEASLAFQESPADPDALALAARDARSAFAERRPEAVGELLHHGRQLGFGEAAERLQTQRAECLDPRGEVLSGVTRPRILRQDPLVFTQWVQPSSAGLRNP